MLLTILKQVQPSRTAGHRLSYDTPMALAVNGDTSTMEATLSVLRNAEKYFRKGSLIYRITSCTNITTLKIFNKSTDFESSTVARREGE